MVPSETDEESGIESMTLQVPHTIAASQVQYQTMDSSCERWLDSIRSLPFSASRSEGESLSVGAFGIWLKRLITQLPTPLGEYAKRANEFIFSKSFTEAALEAKSNSASNLLPLPFLVLSAEDVQTAYFLALNCAIIQDVCNGIIFIVHVQIDSSICKLGFGFLRLF